MKLTPISLFAFILAWPAVYFACTEKPSDPLPPLPVIEEFSGNLPTTACNYTTPVLIWKVSGAIIVHIEPGIGQVEDAGIRPVYASSNITYTLTATNKSGTVNRSATIYACPYRGYEPLGLPKIKEYEKYLDTINGFGLIYPSMWIIDKQRFSALNAQSGGELSGVSFSNNKSADEYSYYDVLIEKKDAAFNKRDYSYRYTEQQRLQGYTLSSEKITQLADDNNGIEQYYIIYRKGLKYDHGVEFQIHKGRFWINRYEWPNGMGEHRILYSFSFLL